MSKSDVRRITDILRRNADYLVGSAAHALGALTPELWGYGGLDGSGAKKGSNKKGITLVTLLNVDESIIMGAEGFRRFGNVLVLSVLVDEPGLIADDLSWLEYMGNQPWSPVYKCANAHRLINIYLSACREVLDVADFRRVETVVEKALQLIGREDASPR